MLSSSLINSVSEFCFIDIHILTYLFNIFSLLFLETQAIKQQFFWPIANFSMQVNSKTLVRQWRGDLVYVVYPFIKKSLDATRPQLLGVTKEMAKLLCKLQTYNISIPLSPRNYVRTKNQVCQCYLSFKTLKQVLFEH